MTSVTLPPEAAAYLAELERELADIPAEERADLLEEVEASLVEAGDEPMARLGTPARFAAELRASAGLPPAPHALKPRPSAWRRFTQDPATRAVRRAARELAPIWWAARAVLAVALLSVLSHQSYDRQTIALDGALVVLALAASLAAGLTGRRRALPLRRLRSAVDLGLAVCLLLTPVLVDRIHARSTRYVFVQSTLPPPAGLANAGVPLRNVYPYDSRGRLLHDVRLYDQDGRPLKVGAGANDPNRRPVVTRGGSVVFNAFPIRYYEPGTREVAHPNAVPARLAPAPLQSRSTARRR
jgi:hypothetical protein